MAEELVIFPDVEGIVVDWLNVALPEVDGYATVRAFGRVPSPRPPLFVRVLVTGGVDRTLVTEEALVTIEAWAGTDTAAAALAGIVRALLHRAGRVGWVGSTPCAAVDVLSRPQSLPDPVTDQTRYTAAYAVTLRGTVAK